MYDRWSADELRSKLGRPYVHLLFGARQTGKSTLLNGLIPDGALRFNLADPQERSRHLANPGEFAQACRSLPANKKGQFVFVDEAQSAPSIFDAVQSLYDADKARWRFVLCGSSARRLRVAGANLLPGRSLLHHLYPLTLVEHPAKEDGIPHAASPLPFPWRGGKHDAFPAWDLLDRLAYGALPGIVTAAKGDRPGLLKAYAVVHLEEEIRREALVKDWGAFVRFLQLAAAESGQVLNYSNISKEAGISQPTVKSHYQLLEDMFVGIRVPAYSKSPRKNVLSTPKFLFFDLGIRHAAAGLNPSIETVKANPGPVFEQWVGIELWQRLQYLGEGKLYHQRTRDGAEVDFIIERSGVLTPVEVKWTERPTPGDARHLLAFLQEKKTARHGYVICRCPRPLQLHERVTALPWFCL
jgi:predicted AAA+ superfamily ATPase